jgi:hypothetical protein
MFLADLLFALVIGLVLTAIFSAGLRGERSGGALLVFFLVIFLAAWAGGVWIAPVGPLLFDVYWLPFVGMGLLFALLLLALLPPPAPTPVESAPTPAEDAVLLGMGWFFWIFIIVIGGLVILRYLI